MRFSFEFDRFLEDVNCLRPTFPFGACFRFFLVRRCLVTVRCFYFTRRKTECQEQRKISSGLVGRIHRPVAHESIVPPSGSGVPVGSGWGANETSRIPLVPSAHHGIRLGRCDQSSWVATACGLGPPARNAWRNYSSFQPFSRLGGVPISNLGRGQVDPPKPAIPAAPGS